MNAGDEQGKRNARRDESSKEWKGEGEAHVERMDVQPRLAAPASAQNEKKKKEKTEEERMKIEEEEGGGEEEEEDKNRPQKKEEETNVLKKKKRRSKKKKERAQVRTNKSRCVCTTYFFFLFPLLSSSLCFMCSYLGSRRLKHLRPSVARGATIAAGKQLSARDRGREVGKGEAEQTE